MWSNVNWVIGSARNDRRRHKSWAGTTNSGNLIDGDLTLPVCVLWTHRSVLIPFPPPISGCAPLCRQWCIPPAGAATGSSGYRQEGGQQKKGNCCLICIKTFSARRMAPLSASYKRKNRWTLIWAGMLSWPAVPVENFRFFGGSRSAAAAAAIRKHDITIVVLLRLTFHLLFLNSHSFPNWFHRSR